MLEDRNPDGQTSTRQPESGGTRHQIEDRKRQFILPNLRLPQEMNAKKFTTLSLSVHSVQSEVSIFQFGFISCRWMNSVQGRRPR